MAAEDPIPSTSDSSAQLEPAKTYLQKLQNKLARHGRFEVEWTERYELLERNGYRLRPRFRPGWVPSWQGTKRYPYLCEDGQSHCIDAAIDAVRISDGKPVMVKRVPVGNQEVEILRYFSSPDLRLDVRNHCVPLLDVFHDDEDEIFDYVVEPVLRRFNDPRFLVTADAIEFIRQTLEGLQFMHEEGVAHQDCAAPNIMMDGQPLYPEGFHPSAQILVPAANRLSRYILRIHAPPIKYYFIDFDISMKFDKTSSEPRLSSNLFGQERDAPELAIPEPYDPFALDIFILGKVYQKNILNEYSNLKYLSPMVEAMTQQEPESRISVTRALEMFEDVRRSLGRFALRRRLHPVHESATTRTIYDLEFFLYDNTFLLKRAVKRLLFRKSSSDEKQKKPSW